MEPKKVHLRTVRFSWKLRDKVVALAKKLTKLEGEKVSENEVVRRAVEAYKI